MTMMIIAMLIENRFGDLITTVRYSGSDKPGRASVHRAKLLEELIKVIPPDTAQFSKSLISISEDPATNELSMSSLIGQPLQHQLSSHVTGSNPLRGSNTCSLIIIRTNKRFSVRYSRTNSHIEESSPVRNSSRLPIPRSR